MPLLDHFHPPLRESRHWESFHARWATAIADALNARLPADYFAEAQVHAGGRIEVDVGTFEQESLLAAVHRAAAAASAGATVMEPQTYEPPAATARFPAVFPDSIEVLVFESSGGPTLVAAVELISPGNKDRPETRRAFAAKCTAYLQQGIGLLIVDIVTDCHAQLHNELIALLNAPPDLAMPTEPLYAVAYAPTRRQAPATAAPFDDFIDVWTSLLAVGQPLPELPLSLGKHLFMKLELESAYMEAVRKSRLPVST